MKNINKEINSAKVSVNINTKIGIKIMEKISNMKDSNNSPISFYYQFEDTKSKTKILEIFHW